MHDSEPIVSILVPLHNNENFIEECIDGLLTQSYSRKEIIIVDDGSTDDGASRAERFARNVKILKQTNQGPSAALNAAARVAQGTVFIMHGADDVSLPDRIAIQVEALETTKTHFVSCQPKLINGNGEQLQREDFPVFFRGLGHHDADRLFADLFYDGNFLCAPAMALTRSAWERIGPANEALIQLQDFEYWLRAAAFGYAMTVLEQPLLSYRLHADNLSRAAHHPRMKREHLFVLREISNCVTRNQLACIVADRLPDAPVALGPRTDRDHYRPFLYFSHPSDEVKQIGFDLFCKLLNEANEEKLMSQLGLTRRQAFAYLMQT